MHHFLDHVDHLQEFARYPVDRTPNQRTSNPISTPAVTSNTEEFMDTWTSLFSDVDSSTEPHLDENLFGDETCIPILCVHFIYLYCHTLCKQSIALYFVCNIRRNIHIDIYYQHNVHKCHTHT